LREDLQGDFRGDFDGASRVEAEEEEPRMEYRRTKTGERRRTATVGWFAKARPLLGVGVTVGNGFRGSGVRGFKGWP
jgi:hypothetical protein